MPSIHTRNHSQSFKRHCATCFHLVASFGEGSGELWSGICNTTLENSCVKLNLFWRQSKWS